MPRPSNKSKRRQEIARGLQIVMADQGYEGASVADIARAAGLTTGLVHYHYGSKQEILLALVAHLGDQLQSRLLHRLSTAGQGHGERLGAFIDVHLALGEDADPGALACWVAIGAEALRQPPVAEAYRRVVTADLATLTTLVAEELNGSHRELSGAPAIAAALFAAIQGYYLLAVATPGTVPPGSASPALRAMAQGLLRAGGR